MGRLSHHVGVIRTDNESGIKDSEYSGYGILHFLRTCSIFLITSYHLSNPFRIFHPLWAASLSTRLSYCLPFPSTQFGHSQRLASLEERGQ